jgi:hypothetical protein
VITSMVNYKVKDARVQVKDGGKNRGGATFVAPA